MRHLLILLTITFTAPSAMAQNLSPIQQYLQSEAGYAVPASPAAAATSSVPAQPAYTAVVPQPLPSQPTLSPVQQYLQNEAGYAPSVATAPVPTPQPTAVATSNTVTIMDY